MRRLTAALLRVLLLALGPLLLLARLPELRAVSEGPWAWDKVVAVGLAGLWPLLVWWITRSALVRRFWSGFSDPFYRTGLIVILLLHLMAIVAPLLTDRGPSTFGDPVSDRYQAPSAEHWLGTDLLGRDLFSRVLYGARISLGIGLLSVVLSLLFGVMIGAAAGALGGWGDALLMRTTDLFLAFPRIFLVLLLVAIWSPSPWWIVVVLGSTGWMGVARLVRGGVLQSQASEYVLAARALGLGPLRILVHHVLPATLPPVIAAATLRVGNAILAESFLSFLGLGVTSPDVSWGLLIREGRDTLRTAWWISTFPGLAILFTVVGYNLLGDGLRDLYDRRLGPWRAGGG